ncbi:MAG: DUF4399 domain-containing protein [bacterium]|nr:DUF4399 domain-containing protein [bacterium]
MGNPRPKGSNAGFPGGLRDGTSPISLNCKELIMMSIRACLVFGLVFGGGQTETTIEPAPGEHTLQLVVGDFKHVPHDKPVVSERIGIRVE